MIWEESFGIRAMDGELIPVHRWLPHATPRAVIVISHGMGEYALRYRHTANRLADLGFGVYSNDHRGHGMAVPDPSLLGNFDHGGFLSLVADMQQVIWLASVEYPGAPIILLGHSMGAYAAQYFMLDNSASLAGVALSGGSALDMRCSRFGDGSWSLHGNNEAFEPGRTGFDWLSRDRAAVDRYLDDPLCGFAPTPASQRSLVAAAPRLRDEAELRRIRPDLPVLMFTGEFDPVNGFLRYFHALRERYMSAGLRDVKARVYTGARHEMLNETNRDEVLVDVVSWIGSVLERHGRRGGGPAPTPGRSHRAHMLLPRYNA